MATYTDNYNLIKPTYAEVADIVPLNNNFEKIDNVMHSSQISLAPAYDQTKEYAAGDTVMYELLMYKCTAPTTGVWDPSKWERTTASESGGGGSAELDILGEASGAVASFADGASAGLAKCIVEIVPKQTGSGTPSPDNVRAISGSTSVTVTVSDGETITTKTTPLGQTVYGGRLNVLTGELTVSHKAVTVNDLQWYKGTSGSYARFYSENVSDIKLPSSQTSTDQTVIAEQYETLSIFNDILTTNGGIVVNTTGAINITDDGYTSAADFKTAKSSMVICYELATPQTVQLTPQEVNSLLGQNNISADTGDVDIVYVKASAPIQPNPTGEPTATLSKLGIEGMVFEVPSGGGGSSEEAYDNTERTSGTYFGKPRYRISFSVNAPSGAGTHTIATLSNYASLDKVIKIEGSLNNSNYSWVVPYADGNVDAYLSYDKTTGNINFIVKNDDWNGYIIDFTIYYTKITD